MRQLLSLMQQYKKTRTEPESALSGGRSDHAALETSPTALSAMMVKDRGPARYFHGRTEVLDLFAQLHANARRTRGGTTLLIQGAPGAGKTALLHQCATQARKAKWKVAQLGLTALYNPAVMAECMGKKYASRKEKGLQPGVPITSGTAAREVPGTVARWLGKHAPGTGLVLVLDEAQTIRALAHGPHEAAAMETLEAIHNGKVERPVILLAGGLGSSRAAFGALGISRFSDGCVVNLERLSQAAEKAVIRDWLVKDGGIQGDPTPWIRAIAHETHGWPQHIMCFAQPAARLLQQRDGNPTAADLSYVLAQGRQRKERYYQGRINDVDRITRLAIGKLLRNRPAGHDLEKRIILVALSDGRTPNEAQAEFDTLLHNGVITITSGGSYAVPVPSMRDWIVEHYGREYLLRQEDPGLGR